MSRGDISVRHGLDRLTVLIKANRCTKLIIKVYENYTAGCRNGETVQGVYDSFPAKVTGLVTGHAMRTRQSPMSHMQI